MEKPKMFLMSTYTISFYGEKLFQNWHQIHLLNNPNHIGTKCDFFLAHLSYAQDELL